MNEDRSLEGWARIILGDRYGKSIDNKENKMTQEERKALYEFYVAGVQHHKLHTCIKEMK